MSRLPYISASIPGVGGTIKAEPSHFVVDEIPLYEPCGEGEHIYVTMTREGWTTQALRTEMTRLFSLKEFDIGFAGMKDKQARATQTFSLHLHHADVDEVVSTIKNALPVENVIAKRHLNKLRRGHLLGNRFSIVLSNPEPDCMSRIEEIASVIMNSGLPNFFGEQRLSGDNADRGKKTLLGQQVRKQWLRELLVSAYTSHLFNIWLTDRMERGDFSTLIDGDIAKKTDTGGIFEVESAAVEMPRFINREITYTGPIYGSKMRKAGSVAGEYEDAILHNENISLDMFRPLKCEGSRRAAQLFPQDLSFEACEEGICFTFSIPKGSYATVVMREFMKSDGLETVSGCDNGD